MKKAKCADRTDVVSSEFITFEELGLSQEVVIKLAYLCGFRKLPFPDGINVLLKEVSKPSRCAATPVQKKARRCNKLRSKGL